MLRLPLLKPLRERFEIAQNPERGCAPPPGYDARGKNEGDQPQAADDVVVARPAPGERLSPATGQQRVDRVSAAVRPRHYVRDQLDVTLLPRVVERLEVSLDRLGLGHGLEV